MKCHSNIPKYEEFKFLNECQIQFYMILESFKSAKKLYLETHKISAKFFEALNDADFSPTKKYLERLCKWAVDMKEDPGEPFSERDYIESLHQDLPIYDNLCNKKLIKETDINSFKNHESWLFIVDKYRNLISKSEEKEKIKTKEADVILDDNRWFVISPLTHAASCIFGAGTKWCTTMKDPHYWNDYISQFVKFYYCLDKQQSKDNNMYKFAVAVYPDGTKECYDAEDKKFPFSKVKLRLLDEEIFKAEDVTLEKAIKTWFDKPYTIDEDGFYSTEGSVYVKNWKGQQLPIKFKYVGGHFSCSHSGIKTLEGCPEEVGKDFYCQGNNLTSLEFAPKKCENFSCSSNKLTSLEHSPEITSRNGKFDCSYNKLTTLKGYNTKKPIRDFCCQFNKLKSLEYGPDIVTHYYVANNNLINSEKGFPSKVGDKHSRNDGGVFFLSGNPIDTTKFKEIFNIL